MSLVILKSELKEKKLRNVYLFHGEEEYLKRLYVRTIENVSLDPVSKDLNYLVIEEKFNIDKLQETCETLPFMSDKRLLILKKTKWFKSPKKAEQEGEEEIETHLSKEIESFLENIPSHMVVVFWEEEIDKRKKNVEWIHKNGLIVNFEIQTPDILSKWVAKMVRTMGKTISIHTADILVEYCEPYMELIENEIKKVVTYIGNKETVEIKDLENICHRSVKARVFDLIDAIGEKSPTKAMKVLQEMLELREPLTKIYYMISKHFFNILEAKELNKKGYKGQSLMQKMKVKLFVANKLTKQAAYFSESILQQAVIDCAKLDLEMKCSHMDELKAIEIIITKYTSKIGKQMSVSS